MRRRQQYPKSMAALAISRRTIYRLDRIKTLSVELRSFRIPYNQRFQEGEFRKRVQFMYGGHLNRVNFTHIGGDIDAILWTACRRLKF